MQTNVINRIKFKIENFVIESYQRQETKKPLHIAKRFVPLLVLLQFCFELQILLLVAAKLQSNVRKLFANFIQTGNAEVLAFE